MRIPEPDPASYAGGAFWSLWILAGWPWYGALSIAAILFGSCWVIDRAVDWVRDLVRRHPYG